MRRWIVVMAVALVVWGLLAPTSGALEVGTAGAPYAAGEVRMVHESLKYGAPEMGPFRFTGVFSTGDRSYVGTVRGSEARSATDGSWPTFYEPIELRSDDGRVSGSCSMPTHPPIDTPQLVVVYTEVAPLDCAVSIDGGAPADLVLQIAVVRHTAESQANEAYIRDVYEGVFSGA